MSVFRTISNTEELLAATQDKTARYLILRNDLTDVPSFSMQPFQSITGEFDGKSITFRQGEDGIKLTKANELKNLNINVDPDCMAVFQDNESTTNMGIHHLSRLKIRGMVRIIITDNIKSGKIEASFIHISEAITFTIAERPNRYQVDLMLGAFTVWNMSQDQNCVIETDITHFSCGDENNPVSGSGLVICGTDNRSGSIISNVISTGHIYIKGVLGEGIHNMMSAGVCIGEATSVKHITNYGRITTTGGNAVGLLNWGNVERWHITDCIITHGPNGNGMTNSGNINKLTFTHPIETFGVGARGFYMFDGYLMDVHFDKITTHGDAASAIQFDRLIESISISNGIETFGNSIEVMFADTVMKMGSDGISIRYGGTARLLKISGDVITHGKEAHCIYVESSIERMYVSGEIEAQGEKGVALEVVNGYFGAEQVVFKSSQWVAILLENAKINNCYELIAKGKEYDLLVDKESTVDRNTITPEFLKGIFQPDVRIDYTDDVDMTYRIGLQPKKFTLPKDDVSHEIGEGESGIPTVIE